MEKDIRKTLLGRARDAFSYILSEGVTLYELKEIVNNIPSSEFEPLEIFREIEVDNDRLYNTDVAKTIEYLSAYKDYQLVLDDCDGIPYFYFGRNEKETDEDIICRLLPFVEAECSALSRDKARKNAIKEEKLRLQEKIKELDRQLNSM